MRRVLVILGLLLMLSSAYGAGPDDIYIEIYNSLQQADHLNETGQFRAAAEKYKDVETSLKKFQATYPNWNQKIVRYRSGYVSERLQSLSKFLSPPEGAPAANFVISSKRTTGTQADSDAQVRALADEIRRLETQRANLEGKLREALSMRQDGADNAQLVEAEQKVAALQKERDLLKVALEQTKAAKAQESSSDDPRIIKRLQQERDELQRKLDVAVKQQALTESRYQNELKQAQAKLRQLEELDSERADVARKLQKALDEANLVADGKVPKTDIRRIKKLEQEKVELEQQFDDASKELVSLQVQREQEILAYKSALSRIKELEKERDGLQKRLAGVDTVSPEEKEKITRENSQLRSRLEAYEARPSPFTPEELALFKKPEGPSIPKSFMI